MKLKSLLFGSAAVLAAGTGTQAADLPVAEPVEYVRICDAFGVGFYYIPGTDTCLRVSGRVFAESNYVNGDNFVTPIANAGDFGGPIVVANAGQVLAAGLGFDLFGFPLVGALGFPAVYADEEREFNNWTTRVRGNIRLDARTQTDFGLIRAYVGAEANHGPGTTGDFSNEAYSNSFGIEDAFIQITNDWGTYTAGRLVTFFNFFAGASGQLNSRDVGFDASDHDANLFAWTFGLGNGVSATLSIEDPESGGIRKANTVTFATFAGLPGGFGVLNGVPFGNAGIDNYEGQEAPDVVANVRIDQGWGSAQIMGAVRHLHDVERFEANFPANNIGTALFGREAVPGTDESADGSEIGFAVGAGLGLNLPFFGLRFDAVGMYSEGAIGYVTSDPLDAGHFGGAAVGDFVGPTAEDSLTEAWKVGAGISGKFTETVSFRLAGSYTEVDSAEVTRSLAGVGLGFPGATVTFEGIDYEHFGVLGGLSYTPVSGLSFTWEAAYSELEIQNNAGQRAALCNFCAGEGRTGEFDVYRTTFRVNRDF